MRSKESLADATQIEMREIDGKEAYDRRGDRKWSWGLTRIARDKEGMGGVRKGGGGGWGWGLSQWRSKQLDQRL